MLWLVDNWVGWCTPHIHMIQFHYTNGRNRSLRRLTIIFDRNGRCRRHAHFALDTLESGYKFLMDTRAKIN